MKSFLLLTFFIISFFVRALRWFGIVQQKEYRFDRLFLFLQSKEGITDLLRIVPKKNDLSKTGLKRPKITNRSSIVILIFILFTIFYFIVFNKFSHFLLLNFYPYPIWYIVLSIFISMILYLVLIPFFVIISVLPTSIIAWLQTIYNLFRARRLFEKTRPIVIGITGSYGKTSTKLLLAHVLEQKYSVFKTPRSFNTKYSVANSILTNYHGQEVAIIEYGAYKKGEIKTLTKWIKPTFAIITGLTEQHLGLFGSLENIIKAKSELVAGLPEKSLVICNPFNEETKKIFDLGSFKNHAELVQVDSDLKNENIKNVRLNNEARLQFDFDGKTIITQLIGIQYQEIVKMVVATAQQFNLSNKQITQSLETFVPNEKFILSFSLQSGTRVIDDGDTSNPKGFAAVIEIAKKIKANKKILITPGIIDLGKKSEEIHLELAKSSKKIFDLVVFVGDSGKDEFSTVFGEDLILTQDQLIEILSNIDDEDLIVIEGRMPFWVKNLVR